MQPPDTATHMLRKNRRAVIGLFFMNGLALAAWVVNIPSIQKSIGASHGTLGILLLMLGAGAITGMQIAGPLVDRRGSRKVAIWAAIVLAISLNLLGLSPTAWWLAGSLFIFGIGNGALDVAMNDQAVHVERRYRRPIMASFHAFFSVGGAIGAGIGAVLQWTNAPVQWPLGIAAALTVIITTCCAPRLLRMVPAIASESLSGTVPNIAAARPRIGIKVMLLALLAFLLMLAEGSAVDWSALHAVEHLGQAAAAASLAYAFFATAMTLGRFTVDSIANRFGPRLVVRCGSALAATGMLTVALSSEYPVTLVGWVVLGLGLSGVVPQIFTAAGNIDPVNQGVILSRVVGAGYLGMLAGPAVIGWLSGIVGLSDALLLPAVLCLVGVVFAGQIPGSEGTIQESSTVELLIEQ